MNIPWIKLLRKGLIAVAYSCFIGTAGAQGLDALFTSETNGEIDNILTTTGASNTLFTSTGNFWNGAAYDPQNDLLYIDDVGAATFTPGAVITNTIYSFNPFNPSAGVTEVGTVAGLAAFTGAGFNGGLYYTIPVGSNQLIAYSFAGGVITQVSSQTLGGLGTGNTGLQLGDIDFIGSTLYISAATVQGTTASGTYTLFKYALGNLTTPTFAVAEGKTGVGIGYDINSGQLIVFNNDGTIETVDPNTGAESNSVTITGPANIGGNGDFTIVPEPGTYALWSLMLMVALVTLHRTLRPKLKLQTCSITLPSRRNN